MIHHVILSWVLCEKFIILFVGEFKRDIELNQYTFSISFRLYREKTNMSSSSGNLWGEQGMYDSALLAMMKNCGKIQPFLECIFSFLSRRTDFYIIMEHDKAEMGFRPGVAMNMVIQVCGHIIYIIII